MDPMKRHVLSTFIIIVISLALYANTLKNGFVYDDEHTIINNQLIKNIDKLPLLFQDYYFAISGEESYRPVVTLTYFIEYAIFGIKPWGYHLTNIMIHAFNGVLCYIFITLLFRQPGNNQYTTSGSLFGNLPLTISLLFISNPILSEAVNAISFREDLLVFFFNIATLNTYLVLRSHVSVIARLLLYVLSCLLYSLSLFSKEMALSLPLIIYVYECFFAPTHIDRKKQRIMSVPFNPFLIGYFVITLIYIYLRFHYFQNHISAPISSWSLTERFASLPWLLLNYLRLSLLPISLSAEYVIKPVESFLSFSFISPFLIIVLFSIIIYFLGKKNKWIFFGILLFFISLIPVYNIFPIRNPLAERYLYFPTMGITLFSVLSIRFILKTAVE